MTNKRFTGSSYIREISYMYSDYIDLLLDIIIYSLSDIIIYYKNLITYIEWYILFY